MGPEDVRKALVVGAGAMGNSIALVFARAGIGVGLVDVGRDALDRAMGLIESGLGALVDAGKVGRGEIGTVLGRIHPDTDLEAAAQGVDFVVEAVPEVPEVKKEVFTRLDELCPEEVIIASNTSGLDIFSFAEVARPGRLLIAHWFSPGRISCRWFEVVPGPDTAPGAVSSTGGFMQEARQGCGGPEGFTRAFIVNKIQNMIALAVFELLAADWWSRRHATGR